MPTLDSPNWTNSGLAVPLGSTVPRLWTPPLRELTPFTSYGFDVCDFARDVLGRPLDPWQEWLVIHAGELLPDGRPRFRYVLVLVARQNGKTECLVVLTLYWLFVERRRLVLGTSTNLDYARESWEKAVNLAQGVEVLAAEVPRNGIRRANGEQTLSTVDRCRYKIAASNRSGGRSLTVERLVMDELREHHDWSAWDAATNAMNAVADAQAFAITNQGDERGVVLESLRTSALAFLETGQGDERLGLFEWSAPPRSRPTDVDAQAAANPNLGRRIDPDALMGAAMRAAENGGEQLAGYLTEVLCLRVPKLDPAVDGDAWAGCEDPGDLVAVRRRVALCVDVSLDGLHASLVAAAVLDDGRVRVEVVQAWAGPAATADLRRELPALVRKVRPRVVGWFPAGPAAAVAVDLTSGRPSGPAGWPRSAKVQEITRDLAAVCMGFAEYVGAGQVAHSADPLLNAHVEGAERLPRGDAWVFGRRGQGHCDAVYAAAGAVHLARSLPAPADAVVVIPRRARRNTPNNHPQVDDPVADSRT